jgi:glycosyltransferase involved in cell wall biosynthesis
MRMLLVTHYYSDHRGGVEIVAGELAGRLAGRGNQVVWAASEPAMDSAPSGVDMLPMRSCNITEKRLGFPYPMWSPVSLVRLCRAVQRCDLVHLHDCLYMGNVVAYIFARLIGKPVVVTQHIGIVPYSQRMLRILLGLANHTLGRLVLGGCDQSIFISEKVQEYFTQRIRFRRAPQFVPNGVDTTRFFPIDQEQRRCLRARFGWPTDKLVMFFVGRFVEKKGLPILHRLAKRFTVCQWVFAGWGPENPVDWRLPNVQCLGPVNQQDLPDYYRAADLLVLPSVGEGFPLVIQEAMACGTPVLTSDDTATGMPDIRSVAYVSDLQWESLLSLIRNLVDSPTTLQDKRDQTAWFARQRWDWERCVDEYCRLFAQVTRKQ